MFTLSNNALQAPFSAAVLMRLMLVTVRSSPTVCTFSPILPLNSIQPAQSSCGIARNKPNAISNARMW